MHQKAWRIVSVGFLSILVIRSAALAQPAAPAAAPTSAAGARGPAVPPASSTQPVLQSAVRHGQFLERAKQGNIDLLFTGDSITDFFYYGNPRNPVLNGRTVWDKYFGSLNAADFAVSGARTQHLIYQFQNGELEGFKAKLVVMMIGTNNIAGGNSAEQTVDGIKAIIKEIQDRQPQAKLLLLGIFPRGRTAEDRFRPIIKQVNQTISKWDDGKRIFYMDIGDKFLEPDGSISPEVMPDALHPTEKGYQIWAEAINNKVKELLAAK